MSLSVRLDQKTMHRLESMAQNLGRSKSAIVKEAITSHLEAMKDFVDAVVELKKIRKKKSKLYSLKEAKKELELERKNINQRHERSEET